MANLNIHSNWEDTPKEISQKILFEVHGLRTKYDDDTQNGTHEHTRNYEIAAKFVNIHLKYNMGEWTMNEWDKNVQSFSYYYIIVAI